MKIKGCTYFCSIGVAVGGHLVILSFISLNPMVLYRL